MIVRVTVAACAALMLLASSASAANRKVDIVNKTGSAIKNFYASSTGSDDWEEDILGRDVVEVGETFEIDINDGTGACRFDFKAIFDNGKSSIRRNVNVCEISSFTYKP